MNKIWATTTVILAIVLTTLLSTGFKAEDSTAKEYAVLMVWQYNYTAVLTYPNGESVTYELPNTVTPLNYEDSSKKLAEILNSLAKEGYALKSSSVSGGPYRNGEFGNSGNWDGSLEPLNYASYEVHIFEK